MAIIGTLLTIAVPRYFRALEHARETVLKQDLSILREAIDKHYADLNEYPDTLAALVDKHYIRAVPVDPFTKASRHLDADPLGGSGPCGHPRPAQRGGGHGRRRHAARLLVSCNGARPVPRSAASPTSACCWPWPSWA